MPEYQTLHSWAATMGSTVSLQYITVSTTSGFLNNLTSICATHSISWLCFCFRVLYFNALSSLHSDIHIWVVVSKQLTEQKLSRKVAILLLRPPHHETLNYNFNILFWYVHKSQIEHAKWSALHVVCVALQKASERQQKKEQLVKIT